MEKRLGDLSEEQEMLLEISDEDVEHMVVGYLIGQYRLGRHSIMLSEVFDSIGTGFDPDLYPDRELILDELDFEAIEKYFRRLKTMH